MIRDGIDEESAKKRIDSQMPTQEKRLLADVVIENDNSLGELEYHVNSWYTQNIKRQAVEWRPTVVSSLLAGILGITMFLFSAGSSFFL